MVIEQKHALGVLLQELEHHVPLVGEVHEDDDLPRLDLRRIVLMHARMEVDFAAEVVAHRPCRGKAIGAVSVLDAKGLHVFSIVCSFSASAFSSRRGTILDFGSSSDSSRMCCTLSHRSICTA